MNRILFASIVCCTAALAKVSAYHSVDSGDVMLLETLEAYGCARSDLRVLAPVTHWEVRSALSLDSESKACKAPEWLLYRRARMSRPQVANFTRATMLAYRDDDLPILGTESSVIGLYPMRGGRPFVAGPNISLDLALSAEAGQSLGLAVAAEPGWNAGLRDYRNGIGEFYFREGYVKVGYDPLEITWGRVGLGFGATEHGSLLFSNATKPVDLWMVGLRPITLGESLGQLQLQTWLANGGDSQTVDGSKFWGIGLAWRPAYWFEFGLLELYQLGGRGIGHLSSGDLFKMLIYSGDPALDSRRKAQMGLHLGGWLPHHSAKIYVQFLFEHLGRPKNWLTQDSSFLFGLWLPKVLSPWDFRFEYVSLTPTTYRSSIWTQGLTYEGTLLGHPLGPDAEGAYFDFGLPLIDRWRPSVGLFFEKRNTSKGFGLDTERRVGLKVAASAIWERWQANVGASVASVSNFHYEAQFNRSIGAVEANVKYDFL